MLAACFWLVAAIVAVILILMVAGVASCIVGVAIGRMPVGYCLDKGVFQLVHDWWAEILTTVLALLVAGGGRPPPPSPPPPPPNE